jgi:phosphate transport system permease protein
MKRNTKDKIVESLTGISVLLIIFIIVSILAVTIVGGWPNLNWTFLSEFPKDGMTKGGIFPAIVGTAVMTIIMAVAAVPFGVITAIYLAEYANEKSVIAKTIRFAVKTLAVVPSIIFGLFGLGFFIGFIGKNIDGIFNGGELRWGQPNILWASLTMALLTLPVVIVSVEEAIRTERNAGSQPCTWRNKMADNKESCHTRICFRNSYRNNSCCKQGSRRSCPHTFYRSSLFSG